MTKRVLFFLSLLVSASALADKGKLLVPDGVELLTDQYIVVYDDAKLGASRASDVSRDIAVRYGTATSRDYRHALRGAVMTMDRSTALAVAQDPRVAYVEQDGLSRIVADQPNPTWGLDRVDERSLPLDNNYRYDFDGTGVDVYVIDTGIRTSHVNFGGRARFGTACTGGTGDDNGHGTHVAGTVGSATWGVAKNAELIGVKVCTGAGSCPNSAIICGIDYVAQQKLNSPSTPVVANMSLGGGISTSIDNAVNNAVATGAFFAVAAGNDSGVNACNRSPARAASAYTVGSSTISDARSSFSNIGPCVDIFAPGSSITSTWNTSNTATRTISGTSMASPHVAGAAALILDQNPNLSPAQVASELTARATSGAISNVGSGSPNLLLYTLGGSAPPPPDPGPTCASDALNLSSFSYAGAAGQNQSNNFAVQDGGDEIRLDNNTWIRTTQSFDVGSGTRLEFYYKSGSQGEIHGIGFDENDTLNDAARYFTFWGTQNWTGTGRIGVSPGYSGNDDWQLFSIDVGSNYTGNMRLAFVNDQDSGSGAAGTYRCVRVIDDSTPPPPPADCTVEDSFEAGVAGWSNGAASTCSTGAYTLGAPSQQSNSGVVTQVGGANTGANAIYTATNTSAGADDVDGGNCVLDSPQWNVTSLSELSVWYFHGQRDTGDDAGDGFQLEVSTNGGATWSVIASNGDVRSSAAWTNATANIPAGSNVQLRMQCIDAGGGGDLIECGIDDLSICPQ
ncbi:MAG: S8 family serine peptidase [Gammaproteobacteria bacterium]